MENIMNSPFKAISILYRKSHIWLNNSCAGHQLTAAQASVILILCDFGAMTQDEMTKCLSLDKSVIAKTVTKLEEQGFLIRETHAKDKRTYDIRPTQKALEVYPFIKDQVQEYFEHMTRRMTEQEKAEFCRLLRLAALGQEEENREEHP